MNIVLKIESGIKSDIGGNNFGISLLYTNMQLVNINFANQY